MLSKWVVPLAKNKTRPPQKKSTTKDPLCMNSPELEDGIDIYSKFICA
jgi:hypothetical protein